MSREKLLIVEDDRIIQTILRTKLSEKFELVIANDGEEGFRQAKKEKPDLIISDILMPKTNGFELKKKIQNIPELHLIPFIFLTSKTDNASKIQGLMSGADDYLAKPVDINILVKRIHSLLDRARVYRETSLALFSKQIENKFMPAELLELPGIDFSSVIKPAKIGGGDFIDIIKLNDDAYTLIQGDVMGKGVQAKFFIYAFTGYLRGIIHAAMYDNQVISPAKIVNRFTSLINQDPFLDDIFITFILLNLDLKNMMVTYCNAGYTNCFLFKSTEKRTHILNIGGGIPGFYPNEFKEGSFKLAENDVLCLYSDGISEAKNPAGEMFGDEPIRQILTENYKDSAKQISDLLDKEIKSYTKNNFQNDDISISIIKKEL